MKKFIVLFIICFCLMPHISSAETVVFLTDDYPPYNYLQDGKVIGISADIVRTVCEELGITPDIRVRPWPSAMLAVKEGRADAIFYLYKTQEREQYLYYPDEPIDVPKNVIWTRKDNRADIKIWKDLDHQVVGVIASYSYGSEFDGYSGISKITCKDVDELVRCLRLGQIQYAAAAEMPFRFVGKKNHSGDQFKIACVITESPVYVAFSKAKGPRNGVLAEKFGSVLRRLRKDGRLEEITNRYVKYNFESEGEFSARAPCTLLPSGLR